MAREPEHIELALKRVDRSKRFILATIVCVFIAILFTFEMGTELVLADRPPAGYSFRVPPKTVGHREIG